MLRKLALGLLFGFSLTSGALALDPVRLAIQPVGENAPSFVAAEEGFFKAHGLDVTLVDVPFSTSVVQGLVSGSIEIGSPSAVTLTQAVDAGLDVVGIAGMSVTNHKGARAFILASAQSGVTDLAGLAGKKVAIAGLNGQIDVMLRANLKMHGVDPASMTFVELPFPAQPDAMKAGAIDATLTVDPFVGRIVDSGLGVIIGKASEETPEGITTALYAATSEWAKAHPEEIKAFTAALEDAAAFIASNPDKARADVGVYTKLPPPVLAMVPLATPDPKLTADHLAYWVNAMKDLGMVNKDLDPASLIFKSE